MEAFLIKFLKLSIEVNEALANGIGGTTGGGTPINLKDISPIKETDFVKLLQGIVGWLIAVAVPIAALMILIGGYQIMFAGGDPEKINTGKKTILYTVVGFAIILLAWSFIAVIKSLLGIKD